MSAISWNPKPYEKVVDEKKTKFGEGWADNVGPNMQNKAYTTPEAIKATQDKYSDEENRRQRGRASTILTGGQGILNAPTVSRQTLMGF